MKTWSSFNHDGTEESKIDALRENEERFRRIVEACPISIAVYHGDRIVLVNKSTVKMMAAKGAEDLIGRSIYDFIHPDDREVIKERISNYFESDIQEQVNVNRLIRLDGKAIDVEIVVIPFRRDNMPCAHVFLQDITEQKRDREQIMLQAYYDALTGLPNRVYFTKYLSEALANAEQEGNLLAVLFLDLDRFKNINDTLGHSVGDLLLCAVTERLKDCVGDDGIVSRLAGDEFTILLPKIFTEQKAITVAQSLIDSLAKPFKIQEYELFITTSIGISIYPSDGDTMEILIKNADTAMYTAKEQGKNNFQIFTSEMKIMAFHRLMLENFLRRAWERKELELAYQPLVDAKTLRIVGVEALLRWNSPEMGTVSPADFIPIAEETGLIVPIGEWVLRNAASQNKQWQEAGYPFIRMAVNLSARQFRQHNLIDQIESVLKETGLNGKWLELEMTESIMQDADGIISTLQCLQSMGIRISIDDFGTGYSSLSYLKRLPINALKIDQSFIKNISADPENAAIVKAVITMAHSLKLIVTAEGVEAEAEADFLQNMYCDLMQGYLFSKPLAAEKMEQFLSGKKRIYPDYPF